MTSPENGVRILLLRAVIEEGKALGRAFSLLGRHLDRPRNGSGTLSASVE